MWSASRVDTTTGVVVATWHQSDTPAVRVLDLAPARSAGRRRRPRSTAAPASSGAAWWCSRSATVTGTPAVEARDLATGERQWQTPVPASFEEAIEPAVDAGAVAVVDHFGVVSLLDPATGRIRWQHDLADALIATRMALTRAGWCSSSFSGDLFVLDRADGHLVARLGRDRLGGYAVALRRAPWGPPARAARRPAPRTRGGSTCGGSPEEAGTPPATLVADPCSGSGSRTPAFRGHPGPHPVRRRAEEQPRSSSSEPGDRPRPSTRATARTKGRPVAEATAVVTMKQLLEAGVHFGHQTRRWNPKMKRFIFGERNGIYIIDLQQTLERIDTAYRFVRHTVENGGTVLFVGTKKQAQEPIQKQAERANSPYVNYRWLGGMLTNFQTVHGRVREAARARAARRDRRDRADDQEGRPEGQA